MAKAALMEGLCIGQKGDVSVNQYKLEQTSFLCADLLFQLFLLI